MVREEEKGKTKFERGNFKLKDPGSIPGQSMTFLTLDRLVLFFHLFHRYVVKIMLTEKKKKSTMWELWVKFYLGQMRTVAQGIAFQMALRNCSREASGKVSIYVLLVNGECMQWGVHTFFCRRLLLVSWRLLLVTRNRRHHEEFQCFSRYEEIQARIGLIKSSPENIWLSEDLFYQFSRAQRASFLITVNSFQRVLKVSSCSSS